MGITGPDQQHLTLERGARTPPPAAPPQPRPLRRPLVQPASPARPHMGLSSGGSRARLCSPIYPSFSARQDSAPAVFPGPALLRSQSYQFFLVFSPFSKERAPFSCAPARFPYSCGGGSGGGQGSSKRRGGAATLPHPGLPALSRPHLSPTSGIGPARHRHRPPGLPLATSSLRPRPVT